MSTLFKLPYNKTPALRARLRTLYPLDGCCMPSCNRRYPALSHALPEDLAFAARESPKNSARRLPVRITLRAAVAKESM